MTLLVVGLSHRTCPVALRERLHFPPERLPDALAALQRAMPDCAGVILSTCNRVEIYAHDPARDPDEVAAGLRAFLASWHGVSEEFFAEALYDRRGPEAIGHLFRVASSVDSMVVGEGQIVGQVHDAYLAAQAAQTTDKVVSALFQRAFAISKKVHTQTRIGEGKVSVGSVAVDLAVSIFMDLAGKTVLVVGSGKMGAVTLKNLKEHGVGRILLTNRSPEKAEALAAEHAAQVIAYEELPARLHEADIVITSTGSPEPILGKADFHDALKQRGQAPMFVIDIAIPRDVAQDANDLDDLYLYDIDGLQEVTEANLALRRKAVGQALEIIDAGVDLFVRWQQSLVAEPTIVSMSAELNAIRERELEKTLRSLPDLTDEQREEVAYLSKRIVNNILQRPMTQLKQEVAEHDAPHTVLHLVKRLFGLKEAP